MPVARWYRNLGAGSVFPVPSARLGANSGSQLLPDRLGDAEFVGADASETDGPAPQVVSEHGTGKPGGVGEERHGRAVLHPGAFLEATDVQLHDRVDPMERVHLDSWAVHVGEEGVVTPVPQALLGLVGEPVRRTTSRTVGFLRPWPVV